MRPSRSLPPSRRRGRLAAGAVAAALILAACGGGSDASGSGAEAGEPLPEADAVDESSTEGNAAPAAVGAGYVDLVGPDVIPAAEIDTNILPSVVVDDLNNGRKVNFRNLVPQDKPVLLWMYAPH
jgi:hypothetical protein